MTNSTIPDVIIQSETISVYPVNGEPIKKLFNGLITAAHWRTDKVSGYTDDLTGLYYYTYDDKYQIADASWADDVNRALGTFTRADNKFRLTGQMIGQDKETGFGEDDDNLNDKDQYVEYNVSGKVTKVYDAKNETTGAFEGLKVEYLYDDRGFRLAKVNFETERTTWYIRDASGNMISTYEEAGVPAYMIAVSIAIISHKTLSTL